MSDGVTDMYRDYEENLIKYLEKSKRRQEFDPIAIEVAIGRIKSLEHRISSAQTMPMYDVDGGMLSENRASQHDEEFDVALVIINRG